MKFEIFTRDTSWLRQVRIRHLEADDLPELEWDGEFRHFRRVYMEAYQRFLGGLSVLWVADLPNQGIIGQVFIQLMCDRPELADGVERAYLYSFRVRPRYRGAGLGSKILQVVEEDLLEKEYRYITLNVARDNPRAQKLYTQHGFRVVAPESGEWSYQDDLGRWRHVSEPAWRMEKRIR